MPIIYAQQIIMISMSYVQTRETEVWGDDPPLFSSTEGNKFFVDFWGGLGQNRIRNCELFVAKEK